MTDLTIHGASTPVSGDFADELDASVLRHVEDLTAAHAVDEANGDVLDTYVDAAVAEHIEHLAARTLRQEKVLQQELATLAAHRAQAQQSQQDASQRVSAQADHVLELRASITGLAGPHGADAGVVEVDVDRLRAFAAARRKLLEGERASAARRPFGRSVSRLRMRKESAERRARARASVIADHEARLAEADTRLADSLRRFRGDSTVATEAPHATA